MKSPCVTYPPSEPLVLIRASQVRLCDGNHCAAALLSYFGYWHDVRREQMKQAEHANKVAALHGDEGTQDVTLLQYHTEETIEEGLLHLYGRKTIRAGIAVLFKKGFLSLHENPNQRYRFDKTHYFLFHPEKVQEDIGAIRDEARMPARSGKNAACTESNSLYDTTQESLVNTHEVKMPDRQGQNASRSGKNAAPIEEITSEITPEREEPLLSKTALGDETEPAPTNQLTPEELITLYNDSVPSEHPHVTKISEARRRKAQEYLRQFPDRDFWLQTFGEIRKSKMLLGKNPSPGHEHFVATFDWLLTKGSKDQIENCVKVYEGQYRDRAVTQQPRRLIL